MATLYDLLGALPKDSADDLRCAFRRAVKGTHPDLHPGDPGAAQKFREIVRASEILGDQEQRAAYDHLLDLAHLDQIAATEQATAARFHRFSSAMSALAGVLIMTAGYYLPFMHMSAASLDPSAMTMPTVLASSSIAPPVTTGNGAAGLKDESTGTPVETIEPNAVPLPKPIEKPDTARPASSKSGTPRLGPASARQVVPVPRQRPVAQDPSRLESAALMRR